MSKMTANNLYNSLGDHTQDATADGTYEHKTDSNRQTKVQFDVNTPEI